MGGILSGGSNTSTTSSSPPPQVMADYQGLVNRATGVANTPYTAYPGEQVAPLSNQTVTGLGNLDQYAYAAQPYLNQAGQMVNQGAGYVGQGAGMANQGAGLINQGAGYMPQAGSMINTGFGTSQQGAGLINQGAGYMPQAAKMTLAASAPVTPQQFSAGALNQYMDPFTQSVINATQAEFNTQNAQQAQFLNSQNMGAGAFGGDRAGLSQAILAGQQDVSQAPVIAGLNQANFNQALAEFNNQQQTNLGAQEFSQQQLGQMGAQYGNQGAQLGQMGTSLGNLGAQQGQLGAAYGNVGAQLGQMGVGLGNVGSTLGNLGQQQGQLGSTYGQVGTAVQNTGLQGAGSQIQGGLIPQAEQQAIDAALQNDWNAGQAYPFQNTNFLGNIIEGTGTASGGTSSSSTPPPSTASQLLGAGTAAAGIAADLAAFLPASDIRAKENITPVGKTFDGQRIYRYNFKGDPRTQIGLLAQEVEQRHPEAVHEGLGGLKHLDYNAATRESERAGFQSGGGLGGVSPGQLYDLGVNKQASPQGAMALMDPNSGAGFGTGVLGAGQLSRTPEGTIIRATPALSRWAPGQQAVQPGWGGGAASPLNPSQAGPMQGARGPIGAQGAGPMVRPTPGPMLRTGFQGGGLAIGGGDPQMTDIADYGYIAGGAPVAIAQGYGVPSPQSGVAQMLYSGLTGGASGGSNVPPTAYTQIGTESLSPSLPNLSGAAPGTVFKPIDYQDPSQNFQTAGAEASLGPHYFTKGLFGELVYGGQGTAPAGTKDAVNKGELLPRPGGDQPTDTKKTETPPPAPAASPSSSSSPDTSKFAPDPNFAAENLWLTSHGQPAQLSSSQHFGTLGPQTQAALDAAVKAGLAIPGKQAGGRIGLGGLPSYYTPTTGVGRGAPTYNPAIPPLPTPQPIYTPRAIAPRPRPIIIPPRAVPLPPPRPMLPVPQPVASAPPAPRPISLPTLNPDETKDPFVHFPDQSYPQPSSGAPQPDADPEREQGLAKLRTMMGGGRPGFYLGGANAGMLGQMPLAGATGYTPQGHGVTGMDSQGSPMGSGAVAKKAAGFDGLFGSGMQRGGRIGFQSGGLTGLGGLGIMPSGQSDPLEALVTSLEGQPDLSQLIQKAVDSASQTRGQGPPKAPQSQTSQTPSTAADLSSLGKSADTIANHFKPGGGLGVGQTGSGLADLANPANADISGMNVDFSSMGGEFAQGGVVRPGFDAGGGATTGSYGGDEGMGGPSSVAANPAAPSDDGDFGHMAVMGVNAPFGPPAATNTATSGGGGSSGGFGHSGGSGGSAAATAAAAGPSPGGGGPGGGAGGGGHGGAVAGGPGVSDAVNQLIHGPSGPGTQSGAVPGGPGIAPAILALLYGNQQMGTPSQNVAGATLGLGSNGVLGGLSNAAPVSPVTVSPLGTPSPSPDTLTPDQLLKFYFQNISLGGPGQFGHGIGQGPFGGQGGPGLGVGSTVGTTVVANPGGGPSGGASPSAPTGLGTPFGVPGTSMGFPAANPSIGPNGIQGTPAPIGSPLGTGAPPGYGFGNGVAANPGPTAGPGPGQSGVAAAEAAQANHAVQAALAQANVSPVSQGMMGLVGAPAALGLAGLGQGGTNAVGSSGRGGSYQPPQSGGGNPNTGGRGFGLGGFVRSGFQAGGDTTDDAPPTAPVAAPAPFTPPTRQQAFDIAAQEAPRYGLKPDVVTKVLGGEMGAKDPYQVGDAGSSFSPWQLHRGGMNPAMNNPGMGDDYAKATGHDPNDPHYLKEQTDFALAGMAKQGLTPWANTMGKLGLNKWSASNGAPPDGGGALAFAGAGQNQQQQQSPLLHADPATQMNAAMDDAARPPDKKLLPPGLGDTLIAIGAGIMSGRSSHAGVNIGEGLMAGMKYMQTQKQLDLEWQKNQAQIDDYHSQARFRDAQTALGTQNLNIEKLKFINDQRKQQWALGGMQGPMPPLLTLDDLPSLPSLSGAAAPPNAAAKPPVTTPPTTVANGPGKPAGPPSAAAPPTTPPDTTAPPSEAPGGATELGKDPDFVKGNAMIAEGERKNAAGKIAGYDGLGNEEIANGKALVEGAKSRLGPILKGQEEYSGALGESTGKAIAAIPAKMDARQIVDQRLGEIQEMMKTYQPGAFAEEKADLASRVASIFGIDAVPQQYLQNAATFQRFLKDQILNTMDNVKAMGGRPMVTEISSLQKAMAGPEMQPGAASAIIAQARGTLKWQNDHDNALTDWADKNPGQYNTAKFEKQFLKEHDIKNYVTEAKHNFPYQGQNYFPDNPEQREKGQAYMTPKGPRVWTGTGWLPFNASAQ